MQIVQRNRRSDFVGSEEENYSFSYDYSCTNIFGYKTLISDDINEHVKYKLVVIIT